VVVDDGPAAARTPAAGGGGGEKANGENGAARDINNVKIRTRSNLRGNSIIIRIIIGSSFSTYALSVGSLHQEKEVTRGGRRSAGID
jgi:hypothetical protein